MRATVTIDDDLYARAVRLIGPLGHSAVLQQGLRALVERESAKVLARLGGTQQALKVAPRRQRLKP